MDVSTPVSDATDAAEERSLTGDLRDLARNARDLAAAELAYQKSRAAFAGQEAGRIAVLGALAILFLFFAAMALVFGVILGLTPILTAWGATAAVVAALLAGGGICALIALSRWRAMRLVLSSEDES